MPQVSLLRPGLQPANELIDDHHPPSHPPPTSPPSSASSKSWPPTNANLSLSSPPQQTCSATGFGPTPHFRCLIAETADQPTGFALYFNSYSTWRGHHGIRLEDLYVTPQARGQGTGRALLTALARIAVAEGCPRLEWDVLAWNQPAIDFYHRLGATTQSEWRIMRLADDALTTLANS